MTEIAPIAIPNVVTASSLALEEEMVIPMLNLPPLANILPPDSNESMQTKIFRIERAIEELPAESAAVKSILSQIVSVISDFKRETEQPPLTIQGVNNAIDEVCETSILQFTWLSTADRKQIFERRQTDYKYDTHRMSILLRLKQMNTVFRDGLPETFLQFLYELKTIIPENWTPSPQAIERYEFFRACHIMCMAVHDIEWSVFILWRLAGKAAIGTIRHHMDLTKDLGDDSVKWSAWFLNVYRDELEGSLRSINRIKENKKRAVSEGKKCTRGPAKRKPDVIVNKLDMPSMPASIDIPGVQMYNTRSKGKPVPPTSAPYMDVAQILQSTFPMLPALPVLSDSILTEGEMAPQPTQDPVFASLPGNPLPFQQIQPEDTGNKNETEQHPITIEGVSEPRDSIEPVVPKHIPEMEPVLRSNIELIPVPQIEATIEPVIPQQNSVEQ